MYYVNNPYNFAASADPSVLGSENIVILLKLGHPVVPLTDPLQKLFNPVTLLLFISTVVKSGNYILGPKPANDIYRADKLRVTKFSHAPIYPHMESDARFKFPVAFRVIVLIESHVCSPEDNVAYPPHNPCDNIVKSLADTIVITLLADDSNELLLHADYPEVVEHIPYVIRIFALVDCRNMSVLLQSY